MAKAPLNAPTKTTTYPPTFASKVKSLIPPGKTDVTNPYNPKNLEILSLEALINKALRKKFKSSFSPGYKNSMATIEANATKAPDAVKYLAGVLKILSPKASMNLIKPGQKIKPGEFRGLSTADLPLSPTAMKQLPQGDVKKRSDELTQKINEYVAEIARLKQAQEKALATVEKTRKLREKLKGIDETLLKYFSYIEKHCSEFLKAVHETGKFLYRGQMDESLPVFVGNPRTGRQTTDSDPKAQALLDKYFTLMGFKALRSNSIFTTSDEHHASGYGKIYAIFPKNGFSFTWSTEHNDLVLNDVGELENIDDDYEYLGDDYELYIQQIDLPYLDNIEDFLNDHVPGLRHGDEKLYIEAKKIKNNPEFKKLQKAVRYWMQDIDTYDSPASDMHRAFINVMDAFDRAAKKLPNLGKVFPATTKKTIDRRVKHAKEELADNAKVGQKEKASRVIKHYGFTNKNLVAAIKSKNEVYIYGEYVAVDWDKFDKELRKFFLPPKGKTPLKKS